MAQKPSQQQLTAARCKPYVNAACSDLFQGRVGCFLQAAWNS